MSLKDDIAPLIKGDVANDDATLIKYSRDTSIFARKPSVVVFPADENDISALVRFVADRRKTGEHISITPRSAGSDMTGAISPTRFRSSLPNT